MESHDKNCGGGKLGLRSAPKIQKLLGTGTFNEHSYNLAIKSVFQLFGIFFFKTLAISQSEVLLVMTAMLNFLSASKTQNVVEYHVINSHAKFDSNWAKWFLIRILKCEKFTEEDDDERKVVSGEIKTSAIFKKKNIITTR